MIEIAAVIIPDVDLGVGLVGDGIRRHLPQRIVEACTVHPTHWPPQFDRQHCRGLYLYCTVLKVLSV